MTRLFLARAATVLALASAPYGLPVTSLVVV